MTLQFTDKWVWDFWFANDGEDIHVFYLQASNTLAHESLRHWNVSIGHAKSKDLTHWEILPDALRPTPPQADRHVWDDKTTWTGSIIQDEGLWYLFYTGSSEAEKGLVQRIGLATSTDLIHWEKFGDQPLIEIDARWYELLDLSAWHDQAWRDPCVFRHPETQRWHCFITARAKDGAPDGRGVIGHAVSDDLLHWEVLPPITAPGEFGDMEVPQWLPIQGRYYLLFSTPESHHSQARLAREGVIPQGGTHYLVSDSPTEGFHYMSSDFLVGDEYAKLYSGKLVQGLDHQWYYMAFHNLDEHGDFIGKLSDPLPVFIEPNGKLNVKR